MICLLRQDHSGRKGGKSTIYVLNTIVGARIKADNRIAVGEGHGMGPGSKAAVKEWVAKLEPAKPSGLQALPPRTSLPVTSRPLGTQVPR